MIDLIETGKKIRNRRHELGYSADYVANELMITKQAVYHWECGRNSLQIDQLMPLSRLLKCTVEELIAEK